MMLERSRRIPGGFNISSGGGAGCSVAGAKSNPVGGPRFTSSHSPLQKAPFGLSFSPSTIMHFPVMCGKVGLLCAEHEWLSKAGRELSEPFKALCVQHVDST